MPGELHVPRDSQRERESRRRERLIAALVERQRGVVTRQQLRECGLGEGAIEARLARRRLLPIHRGVYAVGHLALTAEARWMAAMLAAGDRAVLSHRSAAALWDLCRERGAIDVTVARHRRPRSGVLIHANALLADEICARSGIPVTTVARTLLDLAAVLDPERLKQAIDEAERRRLTDSPSLPELIARHPGARGLVKLRSILAAGRLGLDIPRSELEIRFLSFLRKRGLPRPEVNVLLETADRQVEVDCLWRSARLVVELDGRAYHSTDEAFENDRLRDRALIAIGLRTMRVTSRQLHREPDLLERDLRAALTRRDARSP